MVAALQKIMEEPQVKFLQQQAKAAKAEAELRSLQKPERQSRVMGIPAMPCLLLQVLGYSPGAQRC